MKELDVDSNDFSPTHPTTPGKYLWHTGDSIALITVYMVHAKFAYGTEWSAYLGVAEHRGSNVAKLSGKFIKLKF